jgi:hypothetical protein
MQYYNLLFFNQSYDYKYKKHKVLRETKNFVWLRSEQHDTVLKVSKKTNRVWIVDPDGIFETAMCNILEKIEVKE